MNVIVQSLGFKAGGELENYIREKIENIRPNDSVTGANVVLFMGPDRATPMDYCEIRLEIPGNDLFVKEDAGDFYAAADACIDKLEKMMRKHKDKMVDRFHGKV